MAVALSVRNKIIATAKQAGTGSIDLAEVLWLARQPSKVPNRTPATYDELKEITGLSRRTVIYLVQVWDRFRPLGIGRADLGRVGWTKLAIIAENCAPGTEKAALEKAEACTAKELPAVLKGTQPRNQKRTVLLRFTTSQYIDFKEVLLENGARNSKNKKWLKGKERALMKALGFK